MTKWEYKVVDGVFTEADLNQFGRDGWELSAIRKPDSSFGKTKNYFKRPLSFSAVETPSPASSTSRVGEGE